AYSISETLTSIEGVNVELRYDSVARNWKPSFEMRVFQAFTLQGVLPVALQLRSGAMARLINRGGLTFGVEGRPGEIVTQRQDGSFRYLADGNEYIFDGYGLLSEFGPRGAPHTGITRNADDVPTALARPNG